MTEAMIAVLGAIALITGALIVTLGAFRVLLRSIGRPCKVANTSWNVNNWS